MKTVLRVKLISYSSMIKKRKTEEYKTQTDTLKELERKHQTTNDPKLLVDITNTRKQINKILLEEIEKKNIFLKQKYYEMGQQNV